MSYAEVPMERLITAPTLLSLLPERHSAILFYLNTLCPASQKVTISTTFANFCINPVAVLIPSCWILVL
jgi:hypothetical protein